MVCLCGGLILPELERSCFVKGINGFMNERNIDVMLGKQEGEYG